MSPSGHPILIVGGGPAGLAVLLAAHRRGQLDALLERGVVLVEAGNALGAGELGRYAILSDSTGRTFADCLDGPPGSPLAALRTHPVASAIADAGDGPVPLELAGRFLSLVGGTMAAVLDRHPDCRVLTSHRALSARRSGAAWDVVLAGPDGAELTIRCRQLVSATGADQPASRLPTERVGGTELARYAERLVQSGDVLATGGLDALAARLRSVTEPSVAIVGGSTSAVSVAHLLLNRLPSPELGPGSVTVLHRQPFRLTYATAADALADGYDEFGPDDLCPITGRVFRLAGLRLSQRELMMRVRGIAGRPAEPRLRLHQLAAAAVDEEARRILDRATVVVAALGYRPRALPLFDAAGRRITLASEAYPGARLVDRACRILDVAGRPVGGAFAIGLASGFLPDGDLGGEPSFRGQANGLWLWQNDVGWLIGSAVLADDPAAADRSAVPQPELVQ